MIYIFKKKDQACHLKRRMKITSSGTDLIFIHSFGGREMSVVSGKLLLPSAVHILLEAIS
jgi:hypothetical protein